MKHKSILIRITWVTTNYTCNTKTVGVYFNYIKLVTPQSTKETLLARKSAFYFCDI